MSNLFQIASKKKFRYPTRRGEVSTEDLWDLSLEDLNNVAVSLHRSVQASAGEISFITPKTPKQKSDEKLSELRLELVKAVIEERLADDAARRERARTRQQREFLSELREKKRMDALSSLSLEEIEKQMQELDGQQEEVE